MKKTRQRISKATSKKTVRKTRLATHNGTLDIENGLGAMKSARAIAQSVKKAADASEHLTTAPFHAAMAALDHLIAFLDRQKARLEEAKVELQKLYGETLDDEPNRRRMAPRKEAESVRASVTTCSLPRISPGAAAGSCPHNRAGPRLVPLAGYSILLILPPQRAIPQRRRYLS